MDNSTERPKPRPPSRKGMGPTAGSFKPGDSRINRGGRPRRALAAAEAVRELVDPQEWVQFELAIAMDEKQPLDVRRASWHALIDRGFVRAPAQLALEVTATASDESAWEGVDVEALRAAEATLLALRGGADGARDAGPSPASETTQARDIEHEPAKP